MTTVEFPTKSTADAIRQEHPDALCPDDDARLKTVRFRSDAPDHVVEEAERRAAMGRGELEDRAGQMDLTDREKDRIDFSEGRASVPHARSVKAIARKHGVDDWLAYYDTTLTVDEHREVMERAGQEGGGKRMDSHENRQHERAAQAAARAQGEECDHARDHCEHGDPEACEFLRDACGFDDEEVETLLEDDGDEMPGPIQGARSQLWQRYKIGLANAKEAAAAINEINRQHGADLVAFEELGGRELTRDDVDQEANA